MSRNWPASYPTSTSGLRIAIPNEAPIFYLLLPEQSRLTFPPKRAAIEETKAVFPPLRQRITDALQKLEDQLELGQERGASEEEIAKAKEVIQQAKAAAN